VLGIGPSRYWLGPSFVIAPVGFAAQIKYLPRKYFLRLQLNDFAYCHSALPPSSAITPPCRLLDPLAWSAICRVNGECDRAHDPGVTAIARGRVEQSWLLAVLPIANAEDKALGELKNHLE
jgi:hypothetical protein